jgi:glycosyltransferase involved in cell wall biosynthesis
MKLFVVGYPSDYGGADTELWHTLRLWRDGGIEVELIPTWFASEKWQRRCHSIGIHTHLGRTPEDLLSVPGLADSVVVSFCNGEFLKHSHRFQEIGCRVVWASCMTFFFVAEQLHLEKHRPFDAYVFQSEYQRDALFPHLVPFGVRDSTCHLIRGYLDVKEFPFRPKPYVPGSEFVLGRITRQDPGKWHPDSWQILDRISCPKRFRLMGWGPQLHEHLGTPPSYVETLDPCQERSSDFLGSLHCVLSPNGALRENWPRLGLEAMASGVPLIVDDAGGWREMIRHGETGFLARAPDEFATYVERLVANDDQRLAIAADARSSLARDLSDPERCYRTWMALFRQLENGGGPAM